MQKPYNWVCADQTVSNHQRANNKLLFSEGQQSQQHHQLDSRVCVFFLSIDRELSESDPAFFLYQTSNSAVYIIMKMMEKWMWVVFEQCWILKGLNYKCCHADGWKLCLILFFLFFYYFYVKFFSFVWHILRHDCPALFELFMVFILLSLSLIVWPHR